MRDDEFKWEPYGAAMTMRACGAVADGKVVAGMRCPSQSHNMRRGLLIAISSPLGGCAKAELACDPVAERIEDRNASRSTISRAKARPIT